MSPAVQARQGMIATSQTLASQIGLSILQDGGNAADAAVAAAAALNVTEPCSTGIGGDMFALFYDARTRRVSALNGSGRAPAALTRERAASDWSARHALTVTVPGACAGWCDLLSCHGTLPIGPLLEPELAEQGFSVAEGTAAAWARSTALLCSELLMPDGRPPRAGERFRNPGLARTLREVAAGGAAAFYQGPIAAAIAQVVQQAGGVLTQADLAAHRSTWDEPIHADFYGKRIWQCPPNGQGLAALLALNVLSGFDLAALDALGPPRWHLMIESMRLAFADARYYVADPEWGGMPIAELLDPAYASAQRRRIDPDRATLDIRRGSPTERGGTVYFCVVDEAGNACSFINSNYMGFGTGLTPQGWGFTLQNRGYNFSLDPQHPNVVAPGKRPYHTIIPGMITHAADDALYGPFGVMGGFMQPQGHLQVVVGMLVDGLDPQAALDRPRFCIDGGEAAGQLLLEAGLPSMLVDGLTALCHPLQSGIEGQARSAFGRGQIIRREPDGSLAGGSDRRADGCALGY